MARIFIGNDTRTAVITGGTGTFGQAATTLLRRIVPKWHLRIFSRDEYKQVNMEAKFGSENISYLIGDVRNLDRLRLAFRGADLVLHAAALKHVPVGEYNPEEIVATNILGSQNVVRACIDEGVKRAVLISSDKAVHPINTYGATKLVAERLFIQGNHYAGHAPFQVSHTDFNVVRYGNVANSRGSVIELFQKLLVAGQPLQVTDPAMTRFWLRIEAAVALALYAAETPYAGCLFIPRLPAFNILDMCTALMKNYYKSSDFCLAEGKNILYTGKRFGEKVHEHLMTQYEREVARIYDIPTYLAQYFGQENGMLYCYVVPPLSQQWQKDNGVLALQPADIQEYESGSWPLRLTVDALAHELDAIS